MLADIVNEGDLLGDVPTMAVTVVEPIEDVAPALEVVQYYTDRRSLRAWLEPIQKKIAKKAKEAAKSKKKDAEDDELFLDEESEKDSEALQVAYFEKFVKTVNGLCIANICRVSETGLRNVYKLREKLAERGIESDDQVWEADEDDVAWLARNMNAEHFNVLMEKGMNQENFYLSLRKKEKN